MLEEIRVITLQLEEKYVTNWNSYKEVSYLSSHCTDCGHFITSISQNWPQQGIYHPDQIFSLLESSNSNNFNQILLLYEFWTNQSRSNILCFKFLNPFQWLSVDDQDWIIIVLGFCQSFDDDLDQVLVRQMLMSSPQKAWWSHIYHWPD